MILSSSSRAFLSASAKSTGLALDAPSPSLDFFTVEPDPFAEEPELRRDWLAPRRDCRVAADDVSTLGAAVDVGAGTDVARVELAEVVRPSTGGVETRGVLGFEDIGVLGLDQDVKKSSSGSSFAATDGSIPSTTIPVGKLSNGQSIMRKKKLQASKIRTEQHPP